MATVGGYVNAAAGAPDYDAAKQRALSAFWLTPDDPAGTDGLSAAGGVRPGSGLQVSLSGSNWQVSPGPAAITKTGATGPYVAAVTAQETGALTPADPTNPRLDIVVLHQYDDDVDGSGKRVPAVEYIVGTPSVSPARPATPDGAELLGVITTPASGTGTPSVDDVRRWSVASGGILPVADQASLPANPYPGQTVYRIDLGFVFYWDGTAWQGVGTTGWTAFNLSTAHWAARGGYFAPAWRLTDGGTHVEWRGGVNQIDTGITTGSIKPFGNNIPAACTPASAVSFPIACGGTGSVPFILRLDIDTTGALTDYWNGSSNPGWMALDGVKYSLV